MAYSKIVNDGRIANELQTMTVSDMIALLAAYKKEFGDIPVFHQKDPEGNGFGTITPRSFTWTSDTAVGTAVFIMPFNEGIEDYLFQG